MTMTARSGISSDGDRFIERRIVMRGERQALDLSYATDGQTLASVSLQPQWEDLQQVPSDLQRLQSLQPVALSRLGDSLARVLFPETIRARFEADCEEARRSGRRVRLGVLDCDSIFPDWPWEYVRLPTLAYVALSPHVSLQRMQPADGNEAASPLELPAGQLLRLLIVYADPNVPGCPPLAADAQVRGLQNLVHQLAPGGVSEILWPAGRGAQRATRRIVASEVARRPPHILVLMAHGDYDPQRREGLIYLEDETGPGGDPVYASELATILNQSDTPALVLLDACWTANRGLKSGGKSVASALTAPHRIVVGMQGLWPASVCVPFWNTFFSSLLAPSSVDEALFAAREQLLRIGPKSSDWGRAALHRSAVQPLPPAIRTRSALRRAALETVVTACSDWVRDNAPGAGALPLGLDSLRAHLGESLTENALWQRLLSWVERDPLWIMLAAEDDEAPVRTTPPWFARLRNVPQKLGWDAAGKLGPWKVKLRAVSWPDNPELSSPGPEVWLPEALRERWPRQASVRWEVCPPGGDGSPWVSALVHVVSPDDASAAEAWLRAFEGEDPATMFKAASCCRELGLFDEVLQRADRLLERESGGVLGLLSHRLLAHAYRDIAQTLQDRPGLQRESIWAAALARQHLRASYATPV